ncbi:MAG TPA: LLM class F420-dependent oxidoreductase [Jiangellaceae bacterium]
MDLRIFTEPQQGASYDDQLAVAKATERLGFDGYFRSDHYMHMGSRVDGLPGPTDAWTTLAGLARETSRIRLGTLVSPVTFRYPGVLAIQVAQVDQMSGGRVELGLGTGWFEDEHKAYGIPFPARRFGLLEEQLAIITGLWSTPVGERFSYDGEHYQIMDSPGLPKPVQSPVPVIVGGQGPTRTPALAARYAAEYNCFLGPLDEVAERFTRVRSACEDAGRDPDGIVFSVMSTVCVGASEAELKRRAAAIGRDVATLRERAIAGTPEEVTDLLADLGKIGASRVYLQVLDLSDLEHLELIAHEVAPHVPAGGIEPSRHVS